jgi:hypothetical protein
MNCVITLAGQGFAFQSGRKVPVALPPAYLPFARTPAADVHSRYRIVSLTTFPPPPPTHESLWEGKTWRMIQTLNGVRIDLACLPTDMWRTVALLTNDFAAGQLAPLAGPTGRPSPYCLNYPADQLLFVNRLAHLKAGVVHASGIEIGGKAALFCGRSGAGKTTLARLWRAAGATLLNDDRMIVRLDGQCPLASATPWHGEDPGVQAGEFPLAGVFFIRQSKRNRIRELASASSLAALLANSVAPFYRKEGLERLLDTWERLARKVAAFELEFAPDARAIDACGKVLGC